MHQKSGGTQITDFILTRKHTPDVIARIENIPARLSALALISYSLVSWFHHLNNRDSRILILNTLIALVVLQISTYSSQWILCTIFFMLGCTYSCSLQSAADVQKYTAVIL